MSSIRTCGVMRFTCVPKLWCKGTPQVLSLCFRSKQTKNFARMSLPYQSGRLRNFTRPLSRSYRAVTPAAQRLSVADASLNATVSFAATPSGNGRMSSLGMHPSTSSSNKKSMFKRFSSNKTPPPPELFGNSASTTISRNQAWDEKLLAEGYTEDELKEYHQVFSLFDTDDSGSIGIDELANAMHSMGMSPGKEELENLIKEVDEDGNGEIDFEEFCKVMKRMGSKNKLSWDDITKQCFEVFDRQVSPASSIQESHFNRNPNKRLEVQVCAKDFLEINFKEKKEDWYQMFLAKWANNNNPWKPLIPNSEAIKEKELYRKGKFKKVNELKKSEKWDKEMSTKEKSTEYILSRAQGWSEASARPGANVNIIPRSEARTKRQSQSHRGDPEPEPEPRSSARTKGIEAEPGLEQSAEPAPEPQMSQRQFPEKGKPRNSEKWGENCWDIS